MNPKQEANEIKTKVLIKIRGNELNTPEKMYMIKISKPNVCLADVKNHLNSNLNLYFSDFSNLEKPTVNYKFLVKSNSDGMEYFEEYNNDEENRILPFVGDKIFLECWCK